MATAAPTIGSAGCATQTATLSWSLALMEAPMALGVPALIYSPKICLYRLFLRMMRLALATQWKGRGLLDGAAISGLPVRTAFNLHRSQPGSQPPRQTPAASFLPRIENASDQLRGSGTILWPRRLRFVAVIRPEQAGRGRLSVSLTSVLPLTWGASQNV